VESKAYTDRHSRIPLVALSTLAAIDDSTAPASGQPPRLRKIFSKSLETPGLSAKNDTPSSLSSITCKQKNKQKEKTKHDVILRIAHT
jgi:hypothetical protein